MDVEEDVLINSDISQRIMRRIPLKEQVDENASSVTDVRPTYGVRMKQKIAKKENFSRQST